jgi:GTP-binding protein
VRIEATFTTSAADVSGLPRDGLPQIALVGRSNVGKSTLINALARRQIARTSAAPGKTRLANFYRVERGTTPSFYLVDLPGYGYARGSGSAAAEFGPLIRTYFGSDAMLRGIVFTVDSRHPGLENDLEAYEWLQAAGVPFVIVATKTDKLSRAERTRAHRALQNLLHGPVLPISAVTGEGLDELWKLLNRLLNHPPKPRPPL